MPNGSTNTKHTLSHTVKYNDQKPKTVQNYLKELSKNL